MPSEAGGLARRADPTTLAEWMDGPCAYEEFRACLLDLAQVNRLTLGYRPTLRWLDRVVAAHRPTQPLHIVDVGFGGGDMLRRIAQWARTRGVAVKLTGIDLNSYAARAAVEFTAPVDSIDWHTGDAYAYAGSVDIVISSLLTHHLTDPQLVRFLAWMERTARLGWFINDLERRAYNLYGFTLAARIFGWHPFVQHDGPVSFRRSFRKQDWQRLCAEAGLDLRSIRIAVQLPGRLCTGRIQ